MQILFRKYQFIIRAFFQLFPGAFCEYFTKYVCANIVLQILINYALNPKAISQLLYANILQTRSYAALRQTYTGSSGQDTVGAGTFWGVLNVSLRASCAQLGLDLTCFVICRPSSVLCRSENASLKIGPCCPRKLSQIFKKGPNCKKN